LANQNLSRLHFSLLPRVSQIMHAGEYNLTRTRNATPTWFKFAKHQTLRGLVNMNTLKVKVMLYSFFNLGARWGWVVNATPWPLYPRERPSTHCTLTQVSGEQSGQRKPLLSNGTITFTRHNAISKILPWRSGLYIHCRMCHSRIGPNKQHPHCYERNGTTEN
jgi:hypothetical protein